MTTSKERSEERVRTARYVVSCTGLDGRAHCYLGIYDDYRDDGLRRWCGLGDGHAIDLTVGGIATLEEAIRECEAAAERARQGGRVVVTLEEAARYGGSVAARSHASCERQAVFVSELPVQAERGLYDLRLGKVHEAAGHE